MFSALQRGYLLIQIGRNLIGESGETNHENITSLRVRAIRR